MKRVLFASLSAACLVTPGFAVNLLTETFTYADGSLVTVSGGAWTTHSGTALQQDVSSGALNLTQAEGEDTNRLFAVQAGGTVYAGADVTFSTLPLGTGEYFMHFKDATTGFRGRVFATTVGAAAGTFRIGITEGAATVPNKVLVDLSLGTTYRVILSTSVATNDSTVEVMGLGTASSPADATTVALLSAIGMRQSTASGNGIGVLRVDNLLVGTERIDVVPEPATILGLVPAFALFLKRRRRK